jgi:hypothetical protein
MALLVSRRAIRAIVIAVVGFVLMASGLLLYDQALSNVQRDNNNCGASTCLTASADPALLYLGLLGMAMLVGAGLLALWIMRDTESKPQNPA